MSFEFTVPGEPVGKGRPRFDTRNGRVYTPRKTSEYEEYVRFCFLKECREAEPEEGPVSIQADAYFKIPKSAKKEERLKMESREVRPIKKPDCDNILKAIADALNGLAYNDDKQIVSACINKFYGTEEKVVVTIKGETL